MNIACQYVAAMTLMRREALRLLKMWSQSIMPSLITMSLYFIIFGKFIGQRIGAMDGISYVQYIAPGLVMIAVITNAYLNVAFSFFLSKFQRNLEEILISPMSNGVLLLGYVFGGVLRAFIVGGLLILITLFFTKVKIYSVCLMILVIFLSGVLFSLAGFLNAVFAKRWDDVGFIPSMVLTPLTYLGGVFYSIHLLPPLWQKVSLANPILYMVNGFRYSMLGVTDIPITIALLIICSFITLLLITNLLLLRWGTGLRT